MSPLTLFLDHGTFFGRWAWGSGNMSPDQVTANALYPYDAHYPLAGIWPGEVRCGQVKRIDHAMQAAWLDLGEPQSMPLAKLPLRKRKLVNGQKLWVRIKTFPREDKGHRVEFVEPARGKEIVGALRAQDAQQALNKPCDTHCQMATHIYTAQADFRRPSGSLADIKTVPEVANWLDDQHFSQTKIALIGEGRWTGTLLVEPGATLCAIDVNGPPAHETNQIAVPEVVRQILRQNLGGIIVIDFLRPATKAERATLTSQVERAFAMAQDTRWPATLAWPKVDISPMDHRGLMIIERERQGINHHEVHASQPELLSVSKRLERAIRLRRPGRDNVLELGEDDVMWLSARPFRMAYCERFFPVRANRNIIPGDFKWVEK